MFPDLIPAETTAGALSPAPRTTTPALFSPTGHAERRFWEFFTAHIRNPNTRLAYLAAVRRFATWCERRGLALDEVEPMVVAAYIEQLTAVLAPASVKQQLAALSSPPTTQRRPTSTPTSPAPASPTTAAGRCSEAASPGGAMCYRIGRCRD